MNKQLVMSLCIATLSLLLNACGSSQALESYQSMTAGSVFTYTPLQTKIFTDTSPAFLQGKAMGGSIAQTPPTIDFGVVVIDAQKYSSDYGDWGNVVLGPDGKYYFGLGDHSDETGGSNGALLMDYNPLSKQPQILLFSKDLLGAGGEGKWHCRMDINPANGDMYFIGFYNGNLIYYNIYSHIARNMGKPAPGNGWQEGTWDYQRNRYYGVGNGNIATNSGGGKVLVYDTLHQKTIFAGFPVDKATGKRFAWSPRARLLDRTTGVLYGTDQATHHLAKYDPATNTFTLMKSTLHGDLRAWTNQKAPDGSFWIFDTAGNVYQFWPEQDKVQYEGKNWGNGVYTASIASSANGKYLYYSVADNAPFAATGGAVIQYNTITHQKKAIAFLAAFYRKSHQYQLTKIYGVALSPDGGTLFAVGNGNYVNGARYPSVLSIAIPAAERA
jgi:hypothetical protein